METPAKTEPTGLPISPLDSALEAVREAIRQEVGATPEKNANCNGDLSALQAELTALRAELEASKAREAAAELKAAHLNMKLKQVQLKALREVAAPKPSGWCACFDFAGQRTAAEAAEKARITAEVHERIVPLMLKITKDASMKDDGTPLLKQENVDSVAVIAMRGRIEAETGLTTDELTTVPLDETTTVRGLADAVADKVADKEIGSKYGTNGHSAASPTSKATAEQAEAETPAKKEATPSEAKQSEETAPTAPKLSPAELLSETGIETVTADTLGNWQDVLCVVDDGRIATLNYLKDRGVGKLKDRQVLATALAKAKRDGKI